MQTLLLQFPGRRYHATPWGHHVNEGLIEWPPSPWRLLRAFLSAGYASGLWNGDGPSQTGRALIQKLAGVLPTYILPPAAGAHSRHYMPLAKFKNKREDTTMVFDTWAQVNGGVLAVTWDVELSPEEIELFTTLAVRLGYLGRSESWIAARLAQPTENLPEGFDCHPSDAPPSPGWEQVALMAIQDENSYAQWRQSAIAQALSSLPKVDLTKRKPTKEDKKVLAQHDQIASQYPPDLIACLQVETSWLRKHGWSQPPGSRRVFYQRPADALEAGAPRPRPAGIAAQPVEAMLMSMTTAGGNNHALPSIVRTLPQAELLHRALVSFATRNNTGFSAALIGRDEDAKPLRGPHEHAHILPLDLDDDGHLDHILIWAPMGLDVASQQAVRDIRRTYTKGGIGPLRLALASSGTLDDLCTVAGVYGDNLRHIVGPSKSSFQWRSITPFVPPRYTKKQGRNTLKGQVRAELESRGLQAPLRIEIIDPKENAEILRLRHFVRVRRRGPAPPVDCGFALKLVFARPVRGPLCLGYGSHYGLGLLGAVD
ncbi:MAG: type I-G CRISPR-associated protein Csb2 [Desulfobacterales bacterium]